MPDVGLKERLKAQEEGTDKAAPAAEPLRRWAAERGPVELSHTAAAHNRRRDVEMVEVYYGEGGWIALPYAYLAAVDSPEPGKLVLEFASRHVIVEGRGLAALRRALAQRQVEAIRETERAEFAPDGEAVITRITVKLPGG